MEEKMKNANTSKHIKVTALYERLSIGDERQRKNGEDSNSIKNQKIQLEEYAKQNGFTNIRHYTDDDESGRFFDRDGYSRMMEDVENGKIGIVVMKDLTRWGRDHVQVGIAMEIFRVNNVRFIAINHGIDSIHPESLEMAPFINIMSEWYAKDCSKKVKSAYKTKGLSGKPLSLPPYGYRKSPDNKDFWIIDKEAAVVRRIFHLTLDGKGLYQIACILTEERNKRSRSAKKKRENATAEITSCGKKEGTTTKPPKPNPGGRGPAPQKCRWLSRSNKNHNPQPPLLPKQHRRFFRVKMRKPTI